ncbi:MAG TPA: 2Fe-2S iron-sulfur cluster binding domain-containing protein [Rubrivivax sp.]|nr:2Fe-2S iron-sulfur cluster binding domain-containing protein [Rubrivivax sp.]
MAAYTITIDDTGESYRCADQRSVLEGMEALGRKGIPVGCRNGGCGVCKVQVTSGSYSRRVMSREHVSQADEAKGCVLACRIKPTSDLRLSVIGSMKKNVCRTTVERADGSSLTQPGLQETSPWQ